MNLAYKYPIIFWNCACLISDSGGNEEDDEDEEGLLEFEPTESYSNEIEEFTEEDESEVESSYDEEEDCDGYPAEIKKLTNGKKKKKVKATNYGKIAAAIGKIKSTGVTIDPPNINESSYTFSPDVEHNAIRYGMSGITRIGKDLIKEIINHRPYASVSDFLTKVKVTKPQMVNLIKSGSFDSFGDRIEIMKKYIESVSDTKKRVTLQNLKMLIDFNLIPDEYDLQRRVFNFNKYIKKFKDDQYYNFDEIAFSFYSKHWDIDELTLTDETSSGFKIKQTVWDKIYGKQKDIIRPYIKAHAAELLEKINTTLVQQMWDKYCLGSLSEWEMSSISCYLHDHELKNVDLYEYDFENFEELSENPEIDRMIPIKGKMIPIMTLHRIIGTVLDRDKTKKTVTLLTTGGVVPVRIYGGVFAQYDKQISERGADGKKHVIEKSMFTRGNKIIIIGIREGDSFRAKKYSRTPFHLVEQITAVNNDGTIETKTRGEQE